MKSNPLRPWLKPLFCPRTIVLSGALALSLTAFGQEGQDVSIFGANPSLNLFKKSIVPQGELTNQACDPSDLQSGNCDSAGAAEMRSGPRSSIRTPELAHSSTSSGSFQRSGSLEDSQYQHVVDPPTEFQTFVGESVGQNLPIYGASLFERVPSTYAPVDRVPVAQDYTVGPGDELDIRIWGQISSEQRLIVDRAGDIFLPQVGRINVSGLRFGELQGALKTSIGRVFRNFEVSVNLGQLRSIQVFVMGHARRPGTYTVSSLSTLVNALFVSGGPSSQGSMRKIQLNRAGKLVTTFDLYDLLLRGDKTKDTSLKPGDVIFIPPSGPRVAVAGSVENAAIYEIEQHCSLGEILGDAGGLSPMAAGQHAVLERIDHRATLVSENIQLSGPGLQTQLQDGDIINLLKVVPRFSKTVALKGNVADPVRLPWHEGMRVTDLIPEKQALLTRDYWNQHNRLSAANAGGTQDIHNISMSSSLAGAALDDHGATIRKFGRKNEVQPPAPDINWSYAAIERLDSKTLTTHLIPFNLGKAVIEHEEEADLTLQPGDIVNVFSLADFTAPAAEQSRTVRLEGEVKMAGLYSVRPGETLRQLVERAGGLTDKAYLFASEFTREATRREQQKRLNDYLDQTQRELDQNASTLASRSVSAQQEFASRTNIQSQRAALDRIREMPVTGRIVLDLKPESQGATALPDLALENGDRLIVPSRPASVSVIGTVYNQASFLYNNGADVRTYLNLSGGPTKYADTGHMFVLRADGSVIARPGGKLESAEALPGDSIIVPTNLMKTSKVRNLMDWSQVISGFGLGAAAVNVLR